MVDIELLGIWPLLLDWIWMLDMIYEEILCGRAVVIFISDGEVAER